VIATPAYTHDDQGNPNWPGPRKFRTRSLANVMAVSVPGDYEAVLTIGVGMRKKTWARVFTLTAPSRVVIDVGR
jgi:hypothetical protein